MKMSRDETRGKKHSRSSGRRNKVYVGAKACKSNGWFILLGKRDLILRGDGRGETEERAQDMSRKLSSSAKFHFCEELQSVSHTAFWKGGI